MKFFLDLFKGIIIGIGSVSPGVSGGAFAVMLGVYDKLTDAIANVFHNFKRKVITLFPLGLGIVIGILGFSRIMKYLFEFHESQVKFLFIGLMCGTIPSVIKDANKRGFKIPYLIPLIIAFGMTTVFTLLENNVINMIPDTSPGLPALLIYGAIIGFGTIVPGVSSSFILMYIGVYEALLDGLVSFNLMIIIPVGLGFGLSILLFARIINFLFRRAYGYTYYAVLGFVLSSIIAIVPSTQLGLELVFGIVYSVLGISISLGCGKLSTNMVGARN